MRNRTKIFRDRLQKRDCPGKIGTDGHLNLIESINQLFAIQHLCSDTHHVIFGLKWRHRQEMIYINWKSAHGFLTRINTCLPPIVNRFEVIHDAQ